MKILFKKLRDTCTLPTKATEQSAGFDLYAADCARIEPGRTELMECGFSMQLPPSTEAQIRPRGGLAMKHGITVLNTPGTVDADYRGEVKVLLINHGDERYYVNEGDRIAQMVIALVLDPVVFEEVEELDDSERGQGGFGSTGR